ncbi:MAG: hypothetical protein WBX20_10185, partial [Terrimicrobiaceae bacterium]
GDFIIAKLDVFEPRRIQDAFAHISKTAMGWIRNFSYLAQDCKMARNAPHGNVVNAAFSTSERSRERFPP